MSTKRVEVPAIHRLRWACAVGLCGFLLTALGCGAPPSSPDEGVSPSDAGRDAGVDAGRETGVDAGRTGADAGRDTGADAGRDTGADAGRDTGADAGRDTGADAGRDAGADAGRDAGADAAGETGRDAGRDAAANADSDAGAHENGGEHTCASLPPTEDYSAVGPFPDVQMESYVGPNSNYTLYRPKSLGENGFKHPIAAWGNGIMTTPDEYQSLLKHIASHGFVVIGCNDVQAERPCVSAGLDWLVAQNASGPMAGKLDTTREATVGYSWGGGAAIDTANRPNVKATVSLHGMPPRETNAFDAMHAPLLLFTSTGDGFVTKDKYVTPNYEKSKVQTFYATLNDASAGHLYPVDVNAIGCLASIVLGTCADAKLEQGPTVAWLRMLACGDRGARKNFYGAGCKLCSQPWSVDKKNWPQPDAP
jgi:hypothetical protein